MKSLTAFLALVFAGSSGYCALQDNFDAYEDNAAFSAAWTPSTGPGLNLTTSVYRSAPNAVQNPGNTGSSSRRQMDPVYAHELNFSFYFYDFDGGNGRDFASLYGRGGSGEWEDSFVNALSIGKYDATTPGKYAGRLAVPGDAVFGGGADVGPGGWFALGGAPGRSIGWHKASILGGWDEANAGKVIYYFFIDDELGGSISNASDDTFNWVVIGSGLTTFPGPIAFDNLLVCPVPEPGNWSLLIFGILVFTGCGAAGPRCAWNASMKFPISD